MAEEEFEKEFKCLKVVPKINNEVLSKMRCDVGTYILIKVALKESTWEAFLGSEPQVFYSSLLQPHRWAGRSAEDIVTLSGSETLSKSSFPH